MMITLTAPDGSPLLEWHGFAAGPDGLVCEKACEARARAVLAMAARAIALAHGTEAMDVAGATARRDTRYAHERGSPESAIVGRALIDAARLGGVRPMRWEGHIRWASAALVATPTLLATAEENPRSHVRIRTQVLAKSHGRAEGDRYAYEATSEVITDIDGRGRSGGTKGSAADAAMAIALLMGAQEINLKSHRAKKTWMEVPASATLRAADLARMKSIPRNGNALAAMTAIIGHQSDIHRSKS